MAVINATGLWSVSDYGSTPKFNAGEKGQVFVSKKDKDVLKKIAFKVREIAEQPEEYEKRKLWISHNMLESKIPVVFCDPENGWNEIITESMIKCSSELARKWEMVLRKEIFWASRIKDDKVVEPYFDIGYTYAENNWGVDTKIYGGGSGSYMWDGAIKSIEDIKKIKYLKIKIDHETTKKTLKVANEVFGRILEVRLVGKWWWSLGLSIDLAFLRGLENIMWDMVDNRELLHKLMTILRDGTLKKLEYLEKNNLLSLNNDKYVGSGGFGYTEELPINNFNGKTVRLKDTWGFAESQETVGVSSKMFEEFVFKYQVPILEKFGLNCYGCCEPLEKRWHIIKKIPNLRRVSASPWANLEKMVEYLQDKYVFSVKPSPTDLAVPEIDKGHIKKKISNILKITKGCIVEIIMKDNHSLGNNPENLINWVKIVRNEIDKAK